ncbi:hypothetical protein PHLGIDRAFT_31651 [Phlebiopsis gigantea 11061_1 CR5-6]|uniref:Cytochrome P450 n=1 Tax=Phlebiopsis gigantea (strain 11061_1 CR5-6) TaxID=745531 RepID=A0A0C3RT60_PHLG1|nr:hypothetical protein PHLGIDRAFT_31651 [Phlebiopsis gigantea 11061_1 CR5-6]
MSALLTLCASSVAVALLVRWYRWYTHRSLKYIRGPQVKSFLLGNVRDFSWQESVGDLDFKYYEEYGTSWRMQAALGKGVLMTADPKALQHIMHKSGYNYSKTTQAQVSVLNITGRSIIWAPTADIHSRHRKIMNPAFSAPQLRSFLPMFRRSSGKLCQQWKDELLHRNSDSLVLPVNKWLARAALDIIGEAAFDYEFGALDNSENEVTKEYDNMFSDSMLHLPAWNVVFEGLWTYLPRSLVECIRYMPTREYSRFARTLRVVNRVSKQLVEQKSEMLLHGDKTNKDVMSVLVRANASENPGMKLNDEEMVSQMAALMLAGHETTANTVSWLLWELAKHPEFQEKLRVEIVQKRSEVIARGDADFAMEELESMRYLQAAMKETLRYHNIVYHLFRVAEQDDIIPLANPIRTKTGEFITEIPVSAGQVVAPNIAVYNRLPEIWGEDAHTWNPMRHLDEKIDTQIRLGMFGNVMSFSAGLRGCIGWRFSVIEMQAIVADLVENFKFSLPDEKPEIIRVPAGVMGPMVRGREHEGMLLPLRVTAVV